MEIRLYTFDELERYTQAFADGKLPYICLVGSGGLSKSQTVKRIATNACFLVGGQLSAFETFRKTYEYIDEPLVFDDIDDIHKNAEKVRLFKCLCQTDEEKTVGWLTASNQLPKDAFGRPVQKFVTTSHIFMIFNEWENINRNVAALMDRALNLQFLPDAVEVHKQVMTWFRDIEILKYFEHHLDDIHEPTMRTYVHARDMKKAGLDWRFALCQHWAKPIDAMFAIYKLCEMDIPEKKKEELFHNWTGLSRATYYRHKKPEK